jgi:hypothetical protein
MAELSGFPYFEVQFTKDGTPVDQGEIDRLGDAMAPVGDLIVISHGWNNDMADARSLYENLVAQIASMMPKVAGVAGRRFAVAGVLWPSKKFAEEDLIPGGAAAMTTGIVTEDSLAAQLDVLKDFVGDANAIASLDGAKSLLPHLGDDPTAQDAFARIVRSHLPTTAALEDKIPDDFMTAPGDDLLRRLGRPFRPSRALPGGGGAAMMGTGTAAVGEGAAAGLGQMLSGIKAGARNLLNYVTYYQMKERAGIVGRQGVSLVLRAVRVRRPDLKLHLVGHSFGGRVVTAAIANGQPPLRVTTLTLLQAAFSHFGFARQYDGTKDGLFRKILTEGRVAGPVIITCTVNDRAVGLAYPIASRIARQIASAIGDKDDPYGGIGRNGAQKTPEAVNAMLLATGQPYQLEAGKAYNLNADSCITSHSDIAKPEVAYALLSAVATV